jgi:hypothetical protein
VLGQDGAAGSPGNDTSTGINENRYRIYGELFEELSARRSY